MYGKLLNHLLGIVAVQYSTVQYSTVQHSTVLRLKKRLNEGGKARAKTDRRSLTTIIGGREPKIGKDQKKKKRSGAVR